MDATRIDSLVALCRAGDRNAPLDLWDLVSAPVFRWVLKKFPSLPKSDADAIAMEAFEVALLKLDSFEGRSSFSTWLCGVARLLAIAELRRRGVLARYESVETMPPEVLYHRARKVETGSCEDEMTELLRDLALVLTPSQMDVALLRLRSRFTNRQIARRLGTTIGAVKNLWYRSVPSLERVLEIRGLGLDLVENWGNESRGGGALTVEELCAEVLSEFTDRLVKGEAPSIDLFLLEHPDVASELRPALETVVRMFELFEKAKRERTGRRP